MKEKAYDRLLSIQTTGIREGLSQSVHYNRYEATPYDALDELFRDYGLKTMDQVVDFGCGKGRLPFYVHHHFQVSVTGIEVNGQLYQEALENQASYMRKGKRKDGSLSFLCCPAEKYEMDPKDNRFYFFNPFSIQIFRKVVSHILDSVQQFPRTVDLILYYPTIEYIQFLEVDTMFELVKEVKIPGLYEQNDNERFLIFRYEG